MSSSDVSIEQDEHDVSLENSPLFSLENSPPVSLENSPPVSLVTGSSPAHSTDMVEELNDIGAKTPPTATPSLNVESTPSLNFESASISFHDTPVDTVGEDVSPAYEHEDIESLDSPTQAQPDLLDILSEVVTRTGEQPDLAAKNPVPFPLTRVKTLMKTDPDTSLVQSDAIFVVGEAARMFLKRFSQDAHKVTTASKRKILNRTDVDTCLNRYQEYSFLEEQLDW